MNKSFLILFVTAVFALGLLAVTIGRTRNTSSVDVRSRAATNAVVDSDALLDLSDAAVNEVNADSALSDDGYVDDEEKDISEINGL